MEANVHMNGSTATIRLGGRFDFNSHREFRDAVDRALGENGVTDVSIDMGGVAYVDSSALGMLLMLRDKARAANRRVVLSGVTGAVRQVLEIANFSKLFTIN